jgi:hypothetical protein
MAVITLENTMKNDNIIDILISMSNSLDQKGMYAEANKIDLLIKKVAEDLADDLMEDAAKDKLHGDQHKLDKNNNGKIDKEDFEILRKKDASLMSIRRKAKARSIRKKRLSRK